MLPRKVSDTSDPLPEEGAQVLQTLVKSPAETKAALEAIPQAPVQEPADAHGHNLSVDLAVYSTFCKLLALHLEAMEGPEGTGPLDDDLAIIMKGEEHVSAAQWGCVVYRAAQKRIVREYLRLANEKLIKVTTELREHAVSRRDGG